MARNSFSWGWNFNETSTILHCLALLGQHMMPYQNSIEGVKPDKNDGIIAGIEAVPDWSEVVKEIDKEKDATNQMIKSDSWTARVNQHVFVFDSSQSHCTLLCRWKPKMSRMLMYLRD